MLRKTQPGRANAVPGNSNQASESIPNSNEIGIDLRQLDADCLGSFGTETSSGTFSTAESFNSFKDNS